MHDTRALPILEAAYKLSDSSQEAIRGIARAAAHVIPCTPVAVACFDTDARLDPSRVRFERADPGCVSRFLAWQRAVPPEVRRLALSLTPRAIQFRPEAREQLPAELEALTQRLFPLCVIANTGDGSGLHITFGSPDLSELRTAQMRCLHAVAQHLAVAWRLRRALSVAAMVPEVMAEPRLHGTLPDPSFGASRPTAREALRRAVLVRERAQNPGRSAKDQELWSALIAGRWSLLDAFTVSGRRYIVAHANPTGQAMLRALSAREHSVLELALAGRSGKWIAFELQLSESAVTRAFRTALRKLGAADATALAGVRDATFEPLEGLDAGVDLAVAPLTSAAPPRVRLSDAERAVVADILGGKRIAAIARERGTSPRTVAHQITSTYQKLGISSRRELIALLG